MQASSISARPDNPPRAPSLWRGHPGPRCSRGGGPFSHLGFYSDFQAHWIITAFLVTHLPRPSAIWHETGTYEPVEGLERWRATGSGFRTGSARPVSMNSTRRRGSDGRLRSGWPWPEGFFCPGCGGGALCPVKSRAPYQSTGCRRQTSLIAGIIFAAANVGLRTWFRASNFAEPRLSKPRPRPLRRSP
jgi:hypothetical protein